MVRASRSFLFSWVKGAFEATKRSMHSKIKMRRKKQRTAPQKKKIPVHVTHSLKSQRPSFETKLVVHLRSFFVVYGRFFFQSPRPDPRTITIPNNALYILISISPSGAKWRKAGSYKKSTCQMSGCCTCVLGGRDVYRFRSIDVGSRLDLVKRYKCYKMTTVY